MLKWERREDGRGFDGRMRYRYIARPYSITKWMTWTLVRGSTRLGSYRTLAQAKAAAERDASRQEVLDVR